MFQIEIFMGFEFCFSVEGCTRTYLAANEVKPSHMSPCRLSPKVNGAKELSRPITLIQESPLPWLEKRQSPYISLG